MKYSVWAYEVPLKLAHPIVGAYFTHTGEIGEAESLENALLMAEEFSDKLRHPLYHNNPFPLDNIRITEYDDDEYDCIRDTRSYEEWREFKNVNT